MINNPERTCDIPWISALAHILCSQASCFVVAQQEYTGPTAMGSIYPMCLHGAVAVSETTTA